MKTPREACPRCGQVGRVVKDATVRAMLEPALAADLLAAPRRFCRTPDCEVLYYAANGRIARKQESRVRVGIKEAQDPIPLCYCFGFSRADVEREIAQAGRSTIPERIAAEVAARRCSCEVKNPSGACCLGEVRAAAAAIQERGAS